jgi:hypothetical protein
VVQALTVRESNLKMFEYPKKKVKKKESSVSEICAACTWLLQRFSVQHNYPLLKKAVTQRKKKYIYIYIYILRVSHLKLLIFQLNSILM